MSMINNGELGADVRAKLNEVIEKIEGVVGIYNDLMIVDGKLQLNGVPVEAYRFEGIATDDVVEITPAKGAGLLVIGTDHTTGILHEEFTGQVLFAMQVGPTVKLLRGVQPFSRKLSVTTNPLDGVTGPAGDLNVSVQDNVIQFENRSGVDLTFSVTIL